MDYSVLHNKKTKISSINNEEIVDLLNLTFIIPENFSFELFRVPAEYIARPDLICLDKYGTSQYVDIICKLNGISNPFELNEGDLIALPDTSYLNKFMYSKDTIDQDADSSNNSTRTARPKTMRESRQANEAVIGDKRYRIDKNNGVVIY